MEQWKEIKGFTNYQISNYGRVKRVERTIINKRGRFMYMKEHILKPETTHNGYLRVGLHLNGKVYHKRIATLVAQAFLGDKPDGMEIDHSDGNKQNNIVENLRYVTHIQNINNPVTVAKRNLYWETYRAEKRSLLIA